MKPLLHALVLCAASVAAQATLADTTIRLGGSEDASRTVIQVKNHMARLAHAGQPGHVLYDRARHVAIYVDPERREYREIDQQQLDRYAEIITQLRRQMEQLSAQMQNLPAAQRAFIEQQMGIPAGGLPDLEVMTTESRGKYRVAGFNCELQVLLKDQQPIGEVCHRRIVGHEHNTSVLIRNRLDQVEVGPAGNKVEGAQGLIKKNVRFVLCHAEGDPHPLQLAP